MSIRQRRAFLLCGPASSLAFICADVIGSALASRTESGGYSFVYNSISELLIPTSSSNHLSRRVCLAFMVLSDLLGMAFGFCGLAGRRWPPFVESSDTKNSVRAGKDHVVGPVLGSGIDEQAPQMAGNLLGIAAACNLASAAAFPQDERGADPTFAGNAHLALVGFAATLTIGSMVVFVRSSGDGMPWSRFLCQISVPAFVIMAACAAVTPFLEPKGLLGVGERCSVYTFLVWQALVAMALLRRTGP